MLESLDNSDSPETWLITGGAGYIGSHITDQLISDNKEVIILDSLINGFESRIDFLRKKHSKNIPLHTADIRNTQELDNILNKYKIKGIIHCAALKSVSKSIENPSEYMDVNFNATKNMIEHLNNFGIKYFFFSSSAAVYGSPKGFSPVSEEEPLDPISPYGYSKILAEKVVNDFVCKPGNFGTSFRYFNVVGSANEALLDKSKDNLVPIVVEQIKAGHNPTIYGINYPTSDGSCVRDYIDVRDISKAHSLAIKIGTALPSALNLGSGTGTSVRQVIEEVQNILNPFQLKIEIGNPRVGDPSQLIGNIEKITKVLNFKTKFSLKDSIKSVCN